MEMKSYYLMLLERGPQWSSESSPEVQEVHEAHIAYMLRLR